MAARRPTKRKGKTFPKTIMHKKQRYRAIEECMSLNTARANVRHLKKAGVPATRRKVNNNCYIVYFRRRP